jgi:hypothetical protein
MALRYRGWMLEYLVCSSCSGYSRVGARVLCSEYALNSRFKSFFVLLRNTIMEQALGTSGVERMKSPKKGSPCGKVSQNQASFPASCVHDLIFTCGWRHLPHPHLYSRPSCSEWGRHARMDRLRLRKGLQRDRSEIWWEQVWGWRLCWGHQTSQATGLAGKLWRVQQVRLNPGRRKSESSSTEQACQVRLNICSAVRTLC